MRSRRLTAQTLVVKEIQSREDRGEEKGRIHRTGPNANRRLVGPARESKEEARKGLTAENAEDAEKKGEERNVADSFGGIIRTR